MSRLVTWKTDSQRKPLILRGARQVGKTYCINQFSKEFKSYHVFDFEKNPSLHAVFKGDLTPQKILASLEIFADCALTPGESLIFFDEIQACPRALTSLRYFYEELPELHVIAAGSLLEFALSETSFPVGRVQFDYLYPLSFSEFLQNVSSEKTAALLPTRASIVPSELSPVIYEKLKNHLREYYLVGGMPEAVATFKSSRSFMKVRQVQDALVEAFKNDMQKYTKGKLQIQNISQVFANLFRCVGKEISYSTVGDRDDTKRTKQSLDLLEKAMLCHRVYSTIPSGLPLGADANQKLFKMVFLDIGLGQRLAGLESKEILETNDLLVTYEGKLAEQFVGQELLAETGQGSEGRSLYSWIRTKKGSTAEVDYLLVRDGKIIPVEVKSGSRGRLKSLIYFMEKYKIQQAYCLQDTFQLRTENGVTFLPLFSVL